VVTLVLAASAPSKVPLYIVGGLFVLWALTLAAVGLTHPAFPFGQRGQRGVMAVSALLAVVTMGLAVATSSFGH
jgi:hypothetical protein